MNLHLFFWIFQMKCKPNDIAIIVKNEANAGIGTMLRVTKISKFCKNSWEFEDASRPVSSVVDKHIFYTTSTYGIPGYYFSIEDKTLMPIRNSDGEDETLSWAPVPSIKV